LTAAKARGVTDVAFHKKRGLASKTWSRAAGSIEAAQLPRRDRGRDLLPEASLWFGSLHLARARSLQDLHLVRGGRAQPGSARSSHTGIAPAQTGSFGDGRRKQTSLSTLARQTILSAAAAISTRKAASTRQ